MEHFIFVDIGLTALLLAISVRILFSVFNSNKKETKTLHIDQSQKVKVEPSSKKKVQPRLYQDESLLGPMQFGAIGILQSSYPTRFGCPRQALLVESSRAVLKLHSDLQPENILDGLQQFSHCWLLFYFHENTDMTKTSSNQASKSKVKTKVKVPRLDGRKLGVFSTRTPHRPNPIGLSLVKIDRIEKGLLFLSGVNLLDGTPILDVKPYIPLPGYDMPPDMKNAYVPNWVSNKATASLNYIKWTDESMVGLNRTKKSILFSTCDELKNLIIDTLMTDIRTPRDRLNDVTGKHDGNYCVKLDRIEVHFYVDGDTAYIKSITQL